MTINTTNLTGSSNTDNQSSSDEATINNSPFQIEHEKAKEEKQNILLEFLETIEEYIVEFKKNILYKIFVLAFTLIICTLIVIWIQSQKDVEHLKNTISPLMTILGMLYGTVCVGILKDIFDEYKKIGVCKNVINRIKKLFDKIKKLIEFDIEKEVNKLRENIKPFLK